MMLDNDSVIIEWDGRDYEYRYTFAEIQRMRARGINFARTYRLVTSDPNATMDELDQVAEVVHYVLTSCGASVSLEEIWERVMTNQKYMEAVFQFFIWLGAQHFRVSPTVAGEASPGKPKPKSQKSRSTK